jgi:hypothetical protein
MKLVLQRQFDPPIEHHVPKINNIVMTSEKHSFSTKSNVCSSLSDTIICDVLPTHSYSKKTVATHSQRCLGSEQKLKPSTCGIVQNKSLRMLENFLVLGRSHMLFILKNTSLAKKTGILIILLLLTFHIVIVVRVLKFLAHMWSK